MHIRQILISAAALSAAALLAACGGGGSSHAALPVAATNAPVAGGNTTLGTSHIVIHVKRGSAKKKAAAVARLKAHTKTSKRSAMAAKRKPSYVAQAIAGIQITVQSNVGSRSVYADVSGTSALCTPNGNSGDGTADETCTIAAPIVSANETVTVDELDEAPVDDGTGGNPAGYGDGFPDGAGIVAAISSPETIAAGGGVATISLTPNPVTYDIFACNILNAGDGGGYNDGETTQGTQRMVFTSGVPAQAQGLFQIDAGGYPLGVAGQPWSDVNASPTPITATVQSGTATIAAEPNPGAGLTANPTYGATATFADSVTESYLNGDCFNLVLDVKYDGSTSPSFIYLSNNLTAVNPWTQASQASSFGYAVVPMVLTPPSGNVLSSLAIGASVTVTATDYEGGDGIDTSGSCSNGSTEIASVTPIGSIDTTTWTQQFTVTGVAAGTCSLTVTDDDSNTPTNALTVTVEST
jgi:hypothetical protein